MTDCDDDRLSWIPQQAVAILLGDEGGDSDETDASIPRPDVRPLRRGNGRAEVQDQMSELWLHPRLLRSIVAVPGC